MSWTYSVQMEAAAWRAEDRRRTRCQCGPMPGRCPGPMYCPMSDYTNGTEDEDDVPEDLTEGLEPIVFLNMAVMS